MSRRDLDADLLLCQDARDCLLPHQAIHLLSLLSGGVLLRFFVEGPEGWTHAIARVKELEDEVARLQAMLRERS